MLSPDAIDPRLEATAVSAQPFAGVLLWHRDGSIPDLGASVARRRLWLSGRPVEVTAAAIDASAMLDWLRSVDPNQVSSPSIRAFAALVQLSKSIVRRGSVRPRAITAGRVPSFRYGARPDAEERRALVEVFRSTPPVAIASTTDEPEGIDAGWERLRGLLDALVDARIRRHPGEARYAPGSFEAEVESALANADGAMPHFGAGPRARHVLEQWERAAHLGRSPRTRLVLKLSAPGDGRLFPLSFFARIDEGAESWKMPARAVFLGLPEARLAADDLKGARASLREALHKAGQVLVPVELSLAAEAPDGALLDATEAWALVMREREALERAGIGVEVVPELDGLASRFPRARVRLVRADGGAPDEPSLGSKYRAAWEVVSCEDVLSPTALRTAAMQAPLAQAGGTWMPITAEAGERLAKVAERETAVWTGPQALAAALAGEVRQPGDLADAQVISEPGLVALIAELGRDAVELEPPASLQATLRHYQRRGLSWMFHRTRLGLGALLADDMGLGKTVQLISLLLALRDSGAEGGPTLLVCPASLVGNWERELSRFAPSLRVIRHHGAERRRDAEGLATEAGAHDVVLTTYGLVRRDADWLSRIPFGTVVCDEAQNLKNPQAAQAKAIRRLEARRRVALSGTPVENRLSELWSLMEFLNPGLLGSLDRFRRELALPIERERDARAVRWLQAATRPFLLRRLKTDRDVAPELPEKEIIRTYCSLSEEQARLYQQAVEQSLASIEGAQGIERQGRVLQLLTRLKQVCNHPAQLEESSQELSGRSGKLERAAEMIEEIVESGERALVFTQYVRMGELLVRHLEHRLGREVPLFHGGLDLAARDRMVRRFQEETDGPPVLVLSLKAGGVGLNLTRANHVVHYDRWWNPAVEDQATDRAHRIGQTRRVQVHHLVTMGTLEERIDRMLEEKRQLADAVIEGGEAWLSRLSTDELRALVSLGSDAAVENVESWDESEP